MIRLLDRFKSRLIGQDEVLTEISDLLECAIDGMHYPGQPVASVLALGGTGTGKTDSALIACDALYGPPSDFMCRFDMSEYMVAESVTSFLETFAIKYAHTGGRGFLLFDEIEKAYGQILDLLLQVLSAGRITLPNGRILDLTKYIVFATSNIGARDLMASHDASYELIRDRTISAALRELRPELLPRFDLHAVFNKLGFESALAIANVHIAECVAVMGELGHEIRVTDKARDHIARTGFSELFGAREIRKHAMRVISMCVKRAEIGIGGVKGTIEYFQAKNWIGIIS